MAIKYYVRDATGTVVEVAGRIRALTTDSTVNAEEGSVGMFRVDIDDPDGSYRVGGHRIFYVVETDADPMDQIIAIGYTQERVISRGDLVEGMGTGGRVISVDVADLNTILSRRVMTGADANRPAETDVERVRWLVMTNEAALIIDSRYLDGSSPKNLDAADYRGQMLMSVLQDCAEASGKNYGLTWFQTGADPHTQTAVSFFYLFPGDPIWSSTARLTNVGSDVDDVTTFVVASADLTQSPMRVYSGIYGTGDGISRYDQRLATATAFARRDTIMSFPNVKSATKLTTRIDRMLVDLSTEEYRVAITFNMRPKDVNRIRPGMRVRVRFSHLPELGSGYVWLRMLSRQVTQGEDETGFAFYKVSGVFSAEVPSCAIGFVQQANGGPRGGISTTFVDAVLPAAPTPGNLLVAWCTHRSNDGTNVPIGFTAVSPAYVPIPTEDDGTPSATEIHVARLYYRVAQTGDSATVTSAISGTVDGAHMFVAEFSGCTWTLDTFATATDGTDVFGPAPIVIGAGAVTPTGGPVLLVAGYGSGSGDNDPFGTWTPSAGANLIAAEKTAFSGAPFAAFAYQTIDSPSGSYAPTVTNVGPNTRGTGGSVAAFRTS